MPVQHFPGGLQLGILREDVDLQDGSQQRMVSAKLQLTLLLEGFQSFTLDDLAFDLDARQEPVALMMFMHSSMPLIFQKSVGRPLRKVGLTTPLDWLDNFKLGNSDLWQQHMQRPSERLAFHVWSPGSELIKQATVLEQASLSQSLDLASLPAMSNSIALLHQVGNELLSSNLPKSASRAKLVHADSMNRVRDYVDNHLLEELDLDSVSKATGLGPRTIQRHFKSRFGTTLIGYIRSCRLKLGYDALYLRNATVEQAAFLAGYSSPSNFSTAFKKEFGISPKYCRMM